MSAKQPFKPQRMTRAHAALVLSLLLASCSLLESGSGDTLEGGLAKLRETARSVVADPDRRDRFLANCRELESELLDFERYAAEFASEYRRAFTDYDSDAEDLHRLSAAFRERQRASQARFVELHLAMAAAVTGPEWQSLREQETRIIRSMLDAALKGSG